MPDSFNSSAAYDAILHVVQNVSPDDTHTTHVLATLEVLQRLAQFWVPVPDELRLSDLLDQFDPELRNRANAATPEFSVDRDRAHTVAALVIAQIDSGRAAEHAAPNTQDD